MDHYVLTKTLFALLFLLSTVEGDNKRYVKIAWENCGGTKFKMTDIRTSPKLFHIPDPVNFSMTIEISTMLENISGRQTFQRYENGRFERLPCESTSAGILLGPCEAGDLCEEWAKNCPPIIGAISSYCKCPLPKGEFHIRQSTIDIPWKLEPGNYLLRYEMRKDGELIGCTQGNITAWHLG